MKGLKSLLCITAIATATVSLIANQPAWKNSKGLKAKVMEMKNDTSSFEQYSNRVKSEFDATKKDMERRFIAYRDSVMNEFIAALGKKWDDKKAEKAMPKPIDYSVGPEIVKSQPKAKPDDGRDKEPAPTVEPIPDALPQKAVTPRQDSNKSVTPKKEAAPKGSKADKNKKRPIAEPKPAVTPQETPKPAPEPKQETAKPREKIALERAGKLKVKEIAEIPTVRTNIQPKPFVPVVIPEEVNIDTKFKFTMFGTEMAVGIDDDCRFKLASNTGSGVAKAMEKIAKNDKFGIVLQDCLDLREKYSLCDWAYFLALSELSNAFFGGECNEATLLTGYLFCMSGYQMRFAFDADAKLYLLVASEQYIADLPSVSLNTDNYRRYYVIGAPNKNGMQMSICDFALPKEKALSLWIKDEPKFADSPSPLRQRLVNYPSIKFDYKVNKNLLNFYSTYPTPFTDGDNLSKWTYYAQTPMSRNARETLYPALQNAISEKTDLQAVNIIMDFIESFKYGYDSQIWGYDRAFFPDEPIYYPMSDCEDHAILLTRLVRDLLGLETALIYYPGHLASAVCFKEQVNGDYFLVDGKRYTICDATIYYAGAGTTMSKMNNNEATVILVK